MPFIPEPENLGVPESRLPGEDPPALRLNLRKIENKAKASFRQAGNI